MNSTISAFVHGEIELSQVVFVDGIPYATKTAIGEWLGYTDPRMAVNTILMRNPHIEKHSVDVKLTSTDGKNYDSSVYHPIGFLLIVMESGQPRAKEMKCAVAGRDGQPLAGSGGMRMKRLYLSGPMSLCGRSS